MKLTKRGKLVRALAVALLIGGGVYLLLLVATNFWWTNSGFCWGSMSKCLAGSL